MATTVVATWLVSLILSGAAPITYDNTSTVDPYDIPSRFWLCSVTGYGAVKYASFEARIPEGEFPHRMMTKIIKRTQSASLYVPQPYCVSYINAKARDERLEADRSRDPFGWRNAVRVEVTAEDVQWRSMKAWRCSYYKPTEGWRKSIFATDLPEKAINEQFQKFARQKSPEIVSCNDYNELFKSREDALAGDTSGTNNLLDWSPEVGSALDGERKSKIVFFRDPIAIQNEKGYATTTFDIEYQLIACMGELHLAYSIREDSVRQKKPAYLLASRYRQPRSPLPRISSIPLKGSVYIPPLHNEPIGRFADPFAAKALGFGCFSGQTKKIALLKDHLGPKPTKEATKAFLDKLAVSFETSHVLVSAAAEEELAGGGASTVSSDIAASSAANAAAPAPPEPEAKALNEEYLAKTRAEAEAIAAMKAKQKVDQEIYERGVREAAAAKAQYDREKAAHDAEVARAKAAQEAYQRTMEDYNRRYRPK